MKKIYGFTLVELSIVLVIIGLIVGGVVGGQSLIHSAKLSKVTQEVATIKTAIRAYELQYDALPGDHAEAYDYFDGSGGDSICGEDNNNTTSSCNGNGDGIVEFGNSLTTGKREEQHVFQHLALANILAGSFPSTPSGIAGSTYYKSAIEGAYHHVYYGVIRFSTPSYDAYSVNGVLSPADAKAIDKKIDNGHAGTGSVIGKPGGNGGNQLPCLDGSQYSTASNYDVSKSDIGCIFNFILD
jgi:prepilin-type N-terminal cleavage/methylation domain-containing protein